MTVSLEQLLSMLPVEPSEASLAANLRQSLEGDESDSTPWTFYMYLILMAIVLLFTLLCVPRPNPWHRVPHPCASSPEFRYRCVLISLFLYSAIAAWLTTPFERFQFICEHKSDLFFALTLGPLLIIYTTALAVCFAALQAPALSIRVLAGGIVTAGVYFIGIPTTQNITHARRGPNLQSPDPARPAEQEGDRLMTLRDSLQVRRVGRPARQRAEAVRAPRPAEAPVRRAEHGEPNIPVQLAVRAGQPAAGRSCLSTPCRLEASGRSGVSGRQRDERGAVLLRCVSTGRATCALSTRRAEGRPHSECMDLHSVWIYTGGGS
jgi:hypothetical protein